MTSVQQLRSVIIGLPGFTAAEEQMLLAASPAAGQGSPQCRAALPPVAHNTEFKPQQVPRPQPSASTGNGQCQRGHARNFRCGDDDGQKE